MRPAGTLRAWSPVLALALAALLAWAGPAWSQSTHPFGVPESGGGMAGPGWLAGFFGQVSAWQTHLPSADRRGAGLAGRGGAAWALAGLSFAYGVFTPWGRGMARP